MTRIWNNRMRAWFSAVITSLRRLSWSKVASLRWLDLSLRLCQSLLCRLSETSFCHSIFKLIQFPVAGLGLVRWSRLRCVYIHLGRVVLLVLYWFRKLLLRGLILAFLILCEIIYEILSALFVLSINILENALILLHLLWHIRGPLTPLTPCSMILIWVWPTPL